MKEYKIIKKEFSWSKLTEKLEERLNNYAKKGWYVINVYLLNNGRLEV